MIKVENDNYENPTLERLIEMMVAGTRISGHSYPLQEEKDFEASRGFVDYYGRCQYCDG